MSDAVRWLPPVLGADCATSRDGVVVPLRPPSVEELEAIEQDAHDEGLARGHSEGLAQGQLEIRRLAAQFEGILDNFTRPLGRLENEVVAALSELAVRIAGCLVGRAFEADPNLLAELAREAIEAVGGSQRDVELRMHPDDITMLAPMLDLPPAVRLSADSTLTRGDLRVHAENMRIDGSLDARLRGALDSVLNREAPP